MQNIFYEFKVMYCNNLEGEMPDSCIREHIRSMYLNLLGREPDQERMRYFFDFIMRGDSYNNIIEVIYAIIKSPEFVSKIVVDNKKKHKKNLIVQRSDRYVELNDDNILMFRVENNEDFDWLEQKIIEDVYYETDGVWNLTIDSDRIIMAEILREFHATKVLELGCSTGAILKLLHDAGAIVRGVEISAYNIEKALMGIKKDIYHGDLLDENFVEKQFTLVFGLDIFEHFNPNKLDHYISKIYESLENGRYLFCNIPAFDEDEVFGTDFPFTTPPGKKILNPTVTSI
jgi:2-polyprenyl-3-methyl-5-hydroxy-6-metoxy-1,4-benzoquinol methylase